MTRSRDRRNRYVGRWKEPECRTIDLRFNLGTLRRVLGWGQEPAEAPFTHQEIADWCRRFFLKFLDNDVPAALEPALGVAQDVDAQWELFLANTYSLEELQQLDFSAVRLPTEWFADWLARLDRQPPVPVNFDLVLDALREIAYPEERERLWLSTGDPEVSSPDECRCRLFDDSALGLALEKGVVVSPEIDARLERLGHILRRIESRRPVEEVLSDPKLQEAQAIARELIPLLLY